MLLGIDTSGAVSVAVASGSLDGEPTIRAVRGDERSRHHDEVLLALIDEAMAAAGAQRSDLTGIVVGRGPGPFTGLRVGLVVARSIASVLDVPLHGLSSLDALAHQALAGAGTESASVGVALDARRREVYFARYRRDADGRVTREAEPAVAAPASIADELAACDLLVGSGAALYPELLPATAELVHADAGHLILAAAQLTAQGTDLSSTEPMYLREPDAAKPTARKSALGR
ncbi:tRNA (adenosine(37)-N6)-threonylcarbamoyltransferase complex dimerization subunit type 1 TsaB [Brachybacterium alimentarium]|uniref:tRNA (adenosine(37)-N6)-threonylcarbamoyltransferase complex dimerization subunit type 1 TsaB n=1 Tax=Brachybacterium alimentarium TaxID=47845 RepID=UPI003FB729F0